MRGDRFRRCCNVLQVLWVLGSQLRVRGLANSILDGADRRGEFVVVVLFRWMRDARENTDRQLHVAQKFVTNPTMTPYNKHEILRLPVFNFRQRWW